MGKAEVGMGKGEVGPGVVLLVGELCRGYRCGMRNIGWAVQGSTFRVEKSLNSSYQRDSVFIVFIKPFHPMVYVGIPDLDQYLFPVCN